MMKMSDLRQIDVVMIKVVYFNIICYHLNSESMHMQQGNLQIICKG
jgi:hypothetical protein